MLSVSDLMTAVPNTVTPQTTLRQVIEVMKSQSCRQLPVLRDGKLVGIITDRDVRLVMNSAPARDSRCGRTGRERELTAGVAWPLAG